MGGEKFKEVIPNDRLKGYYQRLNEKLNIQFFGDSDAEQKRAREFLKSVHDMYSELKRSPCPALSYELVLSAMLDGKTTAEEIREYGIPCA